MLANETAVTPMPKAVFRTRYKYNSKSPSSTNLIPNTSHSANSADQRVLTRGGFADSKLQ